MIKVGVLRGGIGKNYDASLFEGGKVISHIIANLSDSFRPIDILVDKDGVLHVGGLPIQPAQLMHKIDVAWDTSHPSAFKTLKDFSIPAFTVDLFSSSLKDSRAMLERHMQTVGVKMPHHILIPVYQEDFDGPVSEYALKKAKEIFEKFAGPWIVKASSGTDMGIHIAKTFPELISALAEAVSKGEGVVVEELIAGSSATMHSVAGFRGEDVYTFPIGNFSSEEKENLKALAVKIYNHLSTPQYLKSDFIIHPKLGIYLSGISFYPELESDSHFSGVCESVGAKPKDVLKHILESTL